MAKKNFAVMMLMSIAAGMMLVSCTDDGLTKSVTTEARPTVDPESGYRWASEFKRICTPQESRFDHDGIERDFFYEEGSLEPVKVFEKTLRSWAKISAAPDTARIEENAEAPRQTAISINRSFKNGMENDNVVISVSDGRVITIKFDAEHGTFEFDGETYSCGFDSLTAARLLSDKIVNLPLTKASSQYVKEVWLTKYPVEVTTRGYNGKKEGGDADLDTLYAYGITKVLADNTATNKKTGYGEKVINETQQKDSVVISKEWPDGHSERMAFNQILNRWLENIERREVDVNTFSGQSADNTFSVDYGDEKPVRSDANWKIYGRKVVITKIVNVDGHSEEVRYTYYQERAEFTYEDINHSFGYVNWRIHNFSDNFVIAPISERSGDDQLNYKNEIQTYYLDYVQMSNEEIAFFKKAVEIIGYSVVNAKREDYPTYTYVYLEKVANYSDGTSKKVGEYSAKLPILVTPKTNWVINTDKFGTYVSNDFSGSQTGKTATTAEKFFAYNKYVYLYSNMVNGERNAFEASVPNDIVFKDGDGVEHKFANTALVVEKKNDATRKTGSESGVDTYAYTCTAGVTFGASQEVSLPGTIIVDTRNHEHGKVRATYMTTTPNESRSFYKSVAVIEFEDGFRKVGMAENNQNSFDFTMTSTVDVNSAVYADGRWMPAKASDDARCMRWRDESGASRRVLDYITATAQSWNNGHNTVVDVRREGKISADGYSVTFYLNGEPGQTLNF